MSKAIDMIAWETPVPDYRATFDRLGLIGPVWDEALWRRLVREQGTGAS
jgi:hypothetical protein